ncbi:hypothetical protein HS088_TW03G00334 [Tripterygium wilfordii]|uniref:Uncharacterized protein n=1 Tax=Tripterygium wilfordii TaxID=458696 RepID=A0A7J7DUG8_TRIWF|nr:hypothetical protein HS088_TW03G00334 [Tripterygium wilfordii]
MAQEVDHSNLDVVFEKEFGCFNSQASNVPAEVKVEPSDDGLFNLLEKGTNSICEAGMPGLKVKNWSDSDFVDALDHIVLKKRQRSLLERKLMGLVKPVREFWPLG